MKGIYIKGYIYHILYMKGYNNIDESLKLNFP